MRTSFQIAIATAVVGGSIATAVATPGYISADLASVNATVTHSWRASGVGSGRNTFVVTGGGCYFGSSGNTSYGSAFVQIQRRLPTAGNETNHVSFYLPGANFSARRGRGSLNSQNKRVSQLIRDGYIRDAQYAVQAMQSIQDPNATAKYKPLIGNVTVQRVAGTLGMTGIGSTQTFNVSGSISYRGSFVPFTMGKPSVVSGSYKIVARKAPAGAS